MQFCFIFSKYRVEPVDKYRIQGEHLGKIVGECNFAKEYYVKYLPMVRVVTLCYCTDWDGNEAETFYEAALWKYRNLEYITNTYTAVVSVTSEELLTSYTIQYNTIHQHEKHPHNYHGSTSTG